MTINKFINTNHQTLLLPSKILYANWKLLRNNDQWYATLHYHLCKKIYQQRATRHHLIKNSLYKKCMLLLHICANVSSSNLPGLTEKTFWTYNCNHLIFLNYAASQRCWLSEDWQRLNLITIDSNFSEPIIFLTATKQQ